MDAKKDFWVRYTGAISDARGKFDSTSPTLAAFFRVLTAAFMQDTTLSNAAVFSAGDGTVMLTSVVRAETSGQAVDAAWEAFQRCIDLAGGSSNLPDGTDDSWHARELLKLTGPVEVRMLQAA